MSGPVERSKAVSLSLVGQCRYLLGCVWTIYIHNQKKDQMFAINQLLLYFSGSQSEGIDTLKA